MYLVPPMDDDPPPEYVTFVTGHLDSLRSETNRLVGGDFEAGHLYMDVLTDVAGHWRRLYWWGRLATLPPAPELPLAGDEAAAGPVRFLRRAGGLDLKTS